MFFLEANGITHHYALEARKHKPVLVFCNSLGSDLRIWDGLVPHLAGDFSIIRYDSRGHGLSDAPAPPYSLDDLMMDLVGVLDRLEIKDCRSVRALRRRAHRATFCDQSPPTLARACALRYRLEDRFARQLGGAYCNGQAVGLGSLG